MLYRIAPLLAALLLAPPALAQDEASPAHALPFPTDAVEVHTVRLAVGGADGPVTVRVAEAPPWLAFARAQAEAAVPEGGAIGTEAGKAAEPVARLGFTVERSAPVGAPAEIVLVVGADGVELARHTVHVVVEPPALSLAAPAPNPSRGGAAVRFTTDGEAVRLSVVDLLGREVAVLADGALSPGAHARRLPGLASGVYVMRLAGVSEVQAERFTVLR